MPLANTTFNDIITFTRASNNATYTDSAGVLQVAATNTPRFDYNPTTLAAQGFLVEEARTNSIVNNMAIGTLAGIPGAVPADWVASGTANGVTREVIGLGTENGVEYIEIRYYGTPTASASIAVTSSLTTTIVAAPGETWAASVYIKLAGGSLSNVTVSNRLNGRTSAGALLESFNTAITPTNASLNTQRSFAIATLANSSTARVTQQTVIEFTNGLAFDATLRLGLPQLEKAAFATSVIKSTPTFVSRSTTGTYVNSSGLLQTAAINVARYTYNPQDLTQPPYLVIETSRTNLVLQSQNFATTWSPTNATVTADSTTAPDGTTTADTINASAAGFVIVSQLLTKSASLNTYSYSMWVKVAAGTITDFNLTLDDGTTTNRGIALYNLTNGTLTSVTSEGGYVAQGATITPYLNSWYRLVVTVTSSAITNVRPRFFYTATGAGTENVYVWGAQLEASSVASSYFPTTTTALPRATDVSTTATVTRAADESLINTLSPWYNATEGTLFAQAVPLAAPLPTAARNLFRINDVANTSSIDIRYLTSQNAGFVVVSASTPQADLTTTNNYSSAVNKLSGAYKALDFAVGLNGVTPVASTTGSVPTGLTSARLGWDGTNYFSGYLQKISYYPQRLTNLQLQALTS
jgi:hypothetical protein